MGHRLQGVVPHRRWCQDRPPDRSGRRLEVSAGMRWAAGDPTGLKCARSSNVPFGSTDCPGPSGPTTAHPSPVWGWGASRSWPYGGSNWGSSLSGSNPVTRSKTDDWNGCTARSRQRRRVRPRRPGVGSRGPLTPFARTTTPSGHMRRWDSSLPPTTTTRRFGPTLAACPPRSTSPG